MRADFFNYLILPCNISNKGVNQDRSKLKVMDDKLIIKEFLKDYLKLIERVLLVGVSTNAFTCALPFS